MKQWRADDEERGGRVKRGKKGAFERTREEYSSLKFSNSSTGIYSHLLEFEEIFTFITQYRFP